MKINEYIDHTLLSPTATKEDIKKLCNEAMQYEFFSVCVNPYYVKLAKEYLLGSNVKVACVVGFPLGQNSTKIKILEAQEALLNGADEIDMVVNNSAFKNGDYDYVLNEINQIKDATHLTLKVIIETSKLNECEIIKYCEIINNSMADCLKTSTGFIGDGAKEEDIKLINNHLYKSKFIKASGGIRDYEKAKNIINLGANRIGTSAGIKIIEETYTRK